MTTLTASVLAGIPTQGYLTARSLPLFTLSKTQNGLLPIENVRMRTRE